MTDSKASASRTLGPWYYDESEDNEYGFIFSSDSDDTDSIAEISKRANPGEAVANSAFIVRACNAHDELIAALRGLVNHDKAMIGSGIMREFVELERASAALKHAEEA